MDAAAELVSLVEQLQQAEDAGIRWSRKHRYRLLRRLEALVGEAFPSYRSMASEIALALLGEGTMPLPPRWWEREQVATTAPAAEDEALALLLGSRDPEYLPEAESDPLTQRYLDAVYRDGDATPTSYLVFALLSLLRALLWGYHRFWRLERGRLVSVRRLLRDVYGVDEETADGISALARRHGTIPLAVNRQAEVILSAFFALPGSLKLLDDLATVYGDVVAGLRRAEGRDGISYPRTPVPQQATSRFLERVRFVHAVLGSARLTAKALRLRKATVLEYLKGKAVETKVFEEALELAQALESVETPRLQRLQVALIALLLAEVRKQRDAVPTNGKGAPLTPTAVAFMVEDVLGIEADPEKLAAVAKLARDEAQLLRALERVRSSTDVKNPIGLLVHILRKWNEA